MRDGAGTERGAVVGEVGEAGALVPAPGVPVPPVGTEVAKMPLALDVSLEESRPSEPRRARRCSRRLHGGRPSVACGRAPARRPLHRAAHMQGRCRVPRSQACQDMV